jgi:hypothetical protein
MFSTVLDAFLAKLPDDLEIIRRRVCLDCRPLPVEFIPFHLSLPAHSQVGKRFRHALIVRCYSLLVNTNYLYIVLNIKQLWLVTIC